MEIEYVSVEDLLSEALVNANEEIAKARPGSPERVQLVQERNSLYNIWIEAQKCRSEMSEGKRAVKDARFRKILDSIKIGIETGLRGAQIVGSLGLAIGIFRLGGRAGFLAADEMKALSLVERVLVK